MLCQKKVINDDNIIKIDVRGLQCPGPIAKISNTMNEAKVGDIVEIKASDPGFGKDVSNLCDKMGYNLLELDKDGMEKMFGMMMPKGVDELKISKMNMAGMGTKMNLTYQMQRTVISRRFYNS